MSNEKTIKSALISVFSKDGLEPIVRELDKQGVIIYSTGGTEKVINDLGIKALDQMQVSQILDTKSKETFYMRSKISPDQSTLTATMRLKVLNDTIPQNAVNQYFT